MIDLIDDGRRIRNWDPFFRVLFDNQDDLLLDCEPHDSTGGMNCSITASSDDSCAIGLAQAHALVVDAFVANGYPEVHDDHEDDIPESCQS